MKKLLSLLLILVFALGAIASCGSKENEALINAGDYINALYKDESTNTTVDYDVVANVVYDGVTYPITWTVDVTEGVTIVDSVNAGFKTVKVVRGDADIPYKLTASITDGTDTVTKTFDRVVPAKVSQAAIVEAAYQLAAGATMDGVQTLTGKIIKIDTPYDAGYKNVTVTIVVENLTDKPIMCYRLKGDNAADLKIGDTITVEGTIKNYNGTIEFDASCQIKAYTAWAPTEAEKVEFEKGMLTFAETIVSGSYDLAGVGATYADVVITWAANPATAIAEGKLVVVQTEAEQTITLTATLTCGTATDTKVITVKVAPKENRVPKLALAADPAKTYVLGINQLKLEKLLFATGEMNGYYAATTEAVELAATFNVELVANTTDKYTLKMTVGTTVKYVNMVASGDYVNIKFEDAASTQYTFNATYGALVANVNNADYFFGVVKDKTHNTFGPVAANADNYPAALYELVNPNTISAADKVATEKNALNINTSILLNTTISLPAAGTTYTDVVITWTADGAPVSGDYAITLGDAARQIALVATIKIGETTDTKTFTLEVAAKPTQVIQKVNTPVVDTWYYFYVVQETLGQTYYFNGANDGYYIGTTLDMNAAVKVKLALRAGTTDEYDIVLDENGTTKYLVTYLSGTYVNGKVDTAPGEVGYKLNPYINGVTIVLNNTTYYLGTFSYNGQDNTNIRASKISFVLDDNNQLKDGTNYVCHFGELVDINTITAADKIAAEKATLNVNSVITEAGNITLPTVGTTYSDVAITWAITANGAATLNGNVLAVTIPAADTTATLTATITAGTTTDTKVFTLTVKAPTLEPDTIAEILAAQDDTAEFWAAGVVVATNGRSFLLKDATGYILVYTNSAPTVAIGDKVDVKGKTSKYKDTWQFTNTGLTVEKTGTETFTQPTPTVLDGAALDAIAAPVAPAYVKVTGILVKSGNYFNLEVVGSEDPGSLTYLAGTLLTDATALDGKLVEVVGYTTGHTGTYVNLMVTSVTEAATTDAEKVEIEKNALSIPTSFSSDNSITLPATGNAYTGVTITWTVNGTAAEGTYAITQTAEAQTLTVIATLACGTATPATKEFTVTVTAKPAEGTTPATFVLTAKDGGTTDVYWNGAVNNGKLQLTTDKASAATVYTEDAGDGKVYIYVMDGATKQYLKMTSDGTTKFALDTTASYKWTVTETSIQSADSTSQRYIYSYKAQDFRAYSGTDYTSNQGTVGLAKLEAIEA